MKSYFLCYIVSILTCGYALVNHPETLSSSFKPNLLPSPLPQRPFVSVWNIDTSSCAKKYHVNIDLSSFDIVINPNQRRDGDKMVIFYSALLGYYPHYDVKGNPIYGGIPQLGNLSAHLEKCIRDIESLIPDKDFEGLAVIDWESWRPAWIHDGWGDGLLYQNASIEKVKNEHPQWSADKIKSQAKAEFENAAKSYMLGTLRLGEMMRPKAKWGYYLFPDCFNYAKKGTDFTCHNDTLQSNDHIEWLFEGSTALYPSTYLGIWFKNKDTAIDYVANRINEAKRVDKNRPDNVSIPIYPYNNLVYRKTREFLTYKDVVDTSGVAAVMGASGVVLWGDYMSDSLEICQALQKYVNKVLGPYLKLASDSAQRCSLEICNGHGRCVVTNQLVSYQAQKIPDLFRLFLEKTIGPHTKYQVSCQCYLGFTGSHCQFTS